MIKIFLIFLLLVHSIITVFSLKAASFLSVFPPFEEAYMYQVFSDLVVAVLLVHVFIFCELKRRKKSLKPLFLCFLGTALMGSFSPLIYLLLEKDLFKD